VLSNDGGLGTVAAHRRYKPYPTRRCHFDFADVLSTNGTFEGHAMDVAASDRSILC